MRLSDERRCHVIPQSPHLGAEFCSLKHVVDSCTLTSAAGQKLLKPLRGVPALGNEACHQRR